MTNYGSGTGPNPAVESGCFVAASYAKAIRKSVGSEKPPEEHDPHGVWMAEVGSHIASCNIS